MDMRNLLELLTSLHSEQEGNINSIAELSDFTFLDDFVDEMEDDEDFDDFVEDDENINDEEEDIEAGDEINIDHLLTN